MYVHIPGTTVTLPFQAPLGSCCNCGGTDAVFPFATPFKHTTYLLFAGTERSFELDLPYCNRCERTARRMRQGPFGRLLIFGLLFFPLLLGSVFVPRELTARFPEGWNGWAAAGVALLATVLTAVFPRARPPRTSWYQPVYLRKLKRAFSGEILSMTFGFTNAAYAAEFSRANADAVAAGVLKVVAKG